MVRVQFTAQVAPAGKAITRYKDRDDHAEYLYTLFVPMDASMAFPCFDQPDLKARFKLEVTAPENWTVVSNTAVENAAAAGRRAAPHRVCRDAADQHLPVCLRGRAIPKD